ncbi:MAG TPA: dTMP kinase [Burkholderiales bacterium]|nr:dTMP kinase [Burkholderiales bacterium]
MSAAGRLITLEGVDGAGKSTHLQFIADAIGAQGHHVIVTREPGGTELAERLRKAILEEPMPPLAETLLIFAARADHVGRVIRPALQSSHWVVCDRFTDATFAYQAAGKGVDRGLIERLRDATHPGLQPDRTLVFDCPYEVARERLAASGKALDRFEREAREFFERVRNAYLDIARQEPRRVRVVDATADMSAIRKAIQGHLAFE